MRVDIITTFPEMMESFFNSSIMGRAQRNGYAEICHSPCKDKLCMRNSKLNKNGESAVCLPLKTIVAICEENGQSEVDGVVG